AGIAVDVGVLEQEAQRLNEAYAVYITERRPFTIAKCAMTLDGKIATRTGSSKWITGEAARAHVHALRGQVDAILVGRRTLDLDDRSLTARGDSPVKQPVRIVLTSGGTVDTGKKVFTVEGGATWVVESTAAESDSDAPYERIRVGRDASARVDMRALMEELGRREIMSLMIEGGGETLAAAFAAGVVDKVMC